MKMSNVIRCPKCSLPLFVEVDDRFMVQNIIIDSCMGNCGCGQEFVISEKVGLYYIDKCDGSIDDVELDERR